MGFGYMTLVGLELGGVDVAYMGRSSGVRGVGELVTIYSSIWGIRAK